MRPYINKFIQSISNNEGSPINVVAIKYDCSLNELEIKIADNFTIYVDCGDNESDLLDNIYNIYNSLETDLENEEVEDSKWRLNVIDTIYQTTEKLYEL